MTILLVDDEQMNLKVLEAMLKPFSYTLVFAENGEKALDELKKQKIDLVLLDIMLPGISGLEVLRRIRADEAVGTIPVILLTALGDREHKIQGLTLGADDYIPKPFDREELLARVNTQMKLFCAREALLEQQQQAYKELEAFSYSAAHDLRAPLMIIDGYAQLISDAGTDKLDEESRQNLSQIIAGAQRMRQLINDLLELSKIDRRELKIIDVDMAGLANASFDELAAVRKDRNIQFHVSDLPKIKGDSGMLRQIFANLISNAVKFTRKKDPAIIDVGCFSKDNDLVYFVKDNGAGFEQKNSNKLFGAFQRLHTQEQFEGTGIGLTIVKRVIIRHGGSIWAESVLDQGTTFYFSFPKSIQSTT